MQRWNPYAHSPGSVWEQHEGGCSASRGKPEAEDNTKAGKAAGLMKRAQYLNKESRAGVVTGTMVGHGPVIINLVSIALRQVRNQVRKSSVWIGGRIREI